jgi:RNA recognition motif-containing protein
LYVFFLYFFVFPGGFVSQKVYVGNLPFNTTEDELREHFMQYGSVTSATIVKDRESGRSRGFGFVELNDATNALSEGNGSSLAGRIISVSVAREREKKPYRK